jgi:AcrR family transcriptional regulator
MTSKRERTAARIFAVALGLFERDGYEATTVGRIAAEAGVSEMTFFRHFATKDALLLDDPYDPLIAAGIAAQPTHLPPLTRAIAGVRAAWTEVPIEGGELMRRRLRVAATPALRGAVSRNTLDTEHVVAGQLVADGADPVSARVAAAALLAAMMAALLDWAAAADDRTMGSAIEQALRVLEGTS